jgi:hypothetical protein
MALTISAGAVNLVAILLGNRCHAAPLVAIAAGQCVFQPFIQVAGAALVARGHAVSSLSRLFRRLCAPCSSSGCVDGKSDDGHCYSAALSCSALYAFPCNPILKASLADSGQPCTHHWPPPPPPDGDRVGFRWEPAKSVSWHVAPFVNLGLLTAIVAATYAMTLPHGLPLAAQTDRADRSQSPARIYAGSLAQRHPSPSTRTPALHVPNRSTRRT